MFFADDIMKKILTIFITLILCLFSVTTVTADGVFTARIETKEAKPGDTVELTVNLENNPGIVALLFAFNFDTTDLKLVNVVDGGLVQEPTFGDKYDRVPYKMFWTSRSPVDFSDDGTLVTLTFEVLPTAKAGMSKVTLTYKQENVFNVDFDDVPLKIVDGGVDIKKYSMKAEILYVQNLIDSQLFCVDITVEEPINTGKIVIAQYKNKQFEQIDVIDVEHFIRLEYINNCDEVKIMWWGDALVTKPLCESIILKINIKP